jgi:drug/metabolite transporter (DMT)-like permease
LSGLDTAELILLGAMWGASFLFMRLAVPEFGPVALIALRVGITALLFVPVLATRRGSVALIRYWKPLAVLGLINSAVPFTLFAYATLHLSAGLAAVLNASVPLFGALVARVWSGESLSASRVGGLVIGFMGVGLLVWDRQLLAAESRLAAVGAALAASLLYALSANFAKRRLSGVHPLVTVVGSQWTATLFILPAAAWLWPAAAPSAGGWGAVLGVAVICTGLAYLLYFRLIDRIGPTRAITVTFLIPIFGVLYGALLLGESVTPRMLAACVVILLGTALTTGILPGAHRPAS